MDESGPLGEKGGINLYEFVGGDPVNYFDPWGLAASEIRNPPGFSDRVKDKLRTDLDRVKNPNRYGENARLDTVMTYASTAGLVGINGVAAAWRTLPTWWPQIPNAIDAADGLMPHAVPAGAGMITGTGKWVWDKGKQLWKWVEDKCKE